MPTQPRRARGGSDTYVPGGASHAPGWRGSGSSEAGSSSMLFRTNIKIFEEHREDIWCAKKKEKEKKPANRTATCAVDRITFRYPCIYIHAQGDLKKYRGGGLLRTLNLLSTLSTSSQHGHPTRKRARAIQHTADRGRASRTVPERLIPSGRLRPILKELRQTTVPRESSMS